MVAQLERATLVDPGTARDVPYPDVHADAGSHRRSYHHRALVVLGALSIAGTAAELSILGHYQSPTQLIPYVVLAGLAAAFWRTRSHVTATTVRVLRCLGLAAIAIATLGSWFHFHANLELAREIDPTRHGIRYLWSGVTGKIPFLAPLVIAQVGLLLLAATVPSSWASASGRSAN